jgi:hypothetical protein
VTRWVYEKVAQNVAHSILWFKLICTYIIFTVEKVSKQFCLCLELKKTTQRAKIRPIWSHWLRIKILLCYSFFVRRSGFREKRVILLTCRKVVGSCELWSCRFIIARPLAFCCFNGHAAGLPDFSWFKIPQRWEIYQIATKLPNGQKYTKRL